MADIEYQTRWRADGKFFRSGTTRVWMKAVTYGPLPGGFPVSFDDDFSMMVNAGFNAIRLFEMPDTRLLDAAHRHGLKVFGGLMWGQNADFFMTPSLLSGARVALAMSLRDIGKHPALAGVYVGNEVPADLVRWMGPAKVRHAIEELIDLGRELSPDLLYAYANYPSTEYLEPCNADFTAFNVYLENEENFKSYLRRLHHVAGDRPLVISEFGLDSSRNGAEKQAKILEWGLRAARELESAGMTVYAWTDRWWNGGAEVLDWSFGLLDRSGNPKPAWSACRDDSLPLLLDDESLISVIICTRNGRSRIGGCINAVRQMTDRRFETWVVDDGSSDGTSEFVREHFPWVRLLVLDHCGLSAARNAGAAAARGEILAFTDDDCEPDLEWLARLRPIFARGNWAAVGGPNLPPSPRTWEEAVVCAAPGAPSHVMLNDVEAEHLPGCNIAVRKSAFDDIGGFDVQFRTAGDDVDFCWRLREAGYRLGFAPGAFVWHWRRPSIRTFLRQQLGYGRAERALIAKHPARFSKQGDAKWEGFVYGGGPVRVMDESIIYYGAMGQAGYQEIVNRMLPLRGIDWRFDSWKSRLSLRVVNFLQPRLRAWARSGRLLITHSRKETAKSLSEPDEEFPIVSTKGEAREDFLAQLIEAGWQPAGDTAAWDLEKSGVRVSMATERFDGGLRRTLVRVWGIGEVSVETLLRSN